MPTRYEISHIKLHLQRVSQSPGCTPEIEGATTYLRTQEVGKKPVVIEASPPADPVAGMIAAGWEPVVLPPGDPGSAGEGQPVGFEKFAEFASIWLDYTVPLKCKCAESGKEDVRDIALSVRYDRRSVRKPGFAVEIWDAKKKEWQPIKANMDEFEGGAAYTWTISIPCPGCGDKAVCRFEAYIEVHWVVKQG